MSETAKTKILILVEGAKRDVEVVEKLFGWYSEIDAKYHIVSYCTNIHVLYDEIFENGEIPDNFDLLQVLKSKESNLEKKKIFDEKYTDILLIFDLDPQDGKFSDDKIRKMQTYFRASDDMGKLYLNYPMVEAFYHMSDIPDSDYQSRTVRIEDLMNGKYKERVQKETRGSDYRKYIKNRSDANYVVLENIRKAYRLLGEETEITEAWRDINMPAVLEKQLESMRDGYLHVLCTCVMFVYDYRSELLFRE